MSQSKRMLSPRQVTAAHVLDAEGLSGLVRVRAQIGSALLGGARNLFIILECGQAIHHCLPQVAEDVKRLQARAADEVTLLLCINFETNFDEPVTYEGPFSEAETSDRSICTVVRNLHDLTQRGVPCAIEFNDPLILQYTHSYAACIVVPPGALESQSHREAASGLPVPVIFRYSGQELTLTAIDAMLAARSPHAFLGFGADGRAATVHSSGNAQVAISAPDSMENFNVCSADIEQKARSVLASPCARPILVEITPPGSGAVARSLSTVNAWTHASDSLLGVIIRPPGAISGAYKYWAACLQGVMRS